MQHIKAIIFDWGRTLYDNDSECLFVGVPELLSVLSKKYQLGIVSLVTRCTPAERRALIEATGMARYFDHIAVTDSDKNKEYDATLQKWDLAPHEIVIIDDRTKRGIQWGNTFGATTIWLQNGKFANELPNNETGAPTHIIRDIGQVLSLFS